MAGRVRPGQGKVRQKMTGSDLTGQSGVGQDTVGQTGWVERISFSSMEGAESTKFARDNVAGTQGI